MSDPGRFLHALGQALAGMGLYAAGHPARERGVETAYRELVDLQSASPGPMFTFLEDETIFGNEPLRELKGWDWSGRLARAGIQRLEFEARVSREDFEGFLDDVLARLTQQAISTTEARQMRRTSIRFGAVGVKGEVPADLLPTATLTLSLGEEAEAVQWLQSEVRTHARVPLLEAEAIVRSLSLAMHADRQIVLPLLQLKEFDQYTTTHSLNVSVLAMGLAEFVGMSPREVRAVGVAGLLHDLGKVRIPLEILTKPGRFTAEEREVMNRHPAEGARIILDTGEQLDLAAVVAYEHHVMIDGGGYPTFRYPRDCHPASRLVHVCDVYDALRTHRPYREAWSSEKTITYVAERAGTEFDQGLTAAFVRMMGQWEPRVAASGTAAGTS